MRKHLSIPALCCAHILLLLLISLAGGCRRSSVDVGPLSAVYQGCSGAACVYALSLRSEAGITAQNGNTSFTLKSEMTVTALPGALSSSETSWLFLMDRITFSGDASAEQQGFQDIPAALQQPFLCVYDAGKNTGIRFAKSLTPPALAIVRTLCAAFQVAPNPAGESTWTANECDASGEYAAQYEKTSDAGVIAKRKLRYLPQTVKDAQGLGLGVDLGVDVKESVGHIKLEAGRVAAIDNTERLEAKLASGTAIVSSTALRLRLQRENAAAPPSLRKQWEQQLPATRFVRATETVVGISQRQHSFDNEKIGDLTLNQVLDYFEQQGGALALSQQGSGDEKKMQLRSDAKMFIALGALLRTHPENTQMLVERVQSGAAATPSLIDALGNTGTKEAQAALLQLAGSESLAKETRVRALRSLTWTKNATEETVLALLQLAEDQTLVPAMLLGLGTLCRRLSQEGKSDLSNRVVVVLLRELDGAQDANATVRALRSISNSGHPGALASVKPYLKHADDNIRAAAIQSVRLMPHADADKMIVHHLKTEQSVTTRIAAVSAAQTRTPSELLADALTQMIFANQDSVSRMRAVQLLVQWLPEMSKLKTVLQQVAANDENEGIRKVATAALAAEGAGV